LTPGSFLRSYGPTPNNLTMFDEYVSSALGRARVAPITLSTPLLDAMVRHIPDGHFKFLHLWPGQIPPGQDSEECLSVG
jgi:hypothetical protein